MSSTGAVTVNLVITALSFLGGLGIVVGYFCNSCAGGGQKLRQRLVLGLGVCDICQALDVLIGSALHLAGRKFPTDSAGCNAIGFVYQTCVVVSASWTLVIAVLTWTTLIRPTSRLSAAIESPRAIYWIWAIVWSAGLVLAIAGTASFAMIDVGGVCWYKAGSLQSKLMIFVPRAIALVGVIVLYTSLFIFFRRRDLSLLHTTSHETEEEDSPDQRRLSLATVGHRLSSWSRRASGTPQASIHNYTRQEFSPPTSAPLSPTSPTPMPPLSQRGSQSVIITLPPSRNQHREGTETDSATSTGELSDMATFPGPPAIGSKNPTPKRPSMAMDEHVQMGSYRGGMPTSTPVPKRLSPRQINKRLSLLMMLYPLAYLLLFSVSVGRLIATLVTDAPTHPALTNIARWLVFGQGLVDGILYFVIEWLFKRSTRGRT